MVWLHGSIMMTWSPISAPVARAYDVPVIWVNACSMQFSLWCMPMDFVSSYLYPRFGPALVLRVATAICLCGVIVRLYACVYDEFWPIFYGTAMIASVYAIFIDSYIIIANKWFPDGERALASTILSSSMVIGFLCSNGLTALTYGSIDD